MRIKRGDIVRIRLDPVEGSEQAGERPAVVISPDIINQHSPVIIVAAITSKKTDKIYPFEVLIHQPDGILNDLWQPVCRQQGSLLMRKSQSNQQKTASLFTV